MQPSFSGLLVTCAYLPHTTLPPVVTRPSSLTLTSITVPFVITPSWVYSGELGFFFTPMIGRLKVALSCRRRRRRRGEYAHAHTGEKTRDILVV